MSITVLILNLDPQCLLVQLSAVFCTYSKRHEELCHLWETLTSCQCCGIIWHYHTKPTRYFQCGHAC